MLDTHSPKVSKRNRFRSPLENWIGVIPFFVFIFVCLILPSLNLFIGAFQDQKGNFTLGNIGLLLDLPLRDLEQVVYFNAYIVIDPGN